jgi:hypothetical protein
MKFFIHIVISAVSCAVSLRFCASANAWAALVAQGRYNLHYCRPMGGIRPLKAFTDSSTGAVLPPLTDHAPLSDAQIEAAARELGLVKPAALSRTRKRLEVNLLPLDLDEGTQPVVFPN